MYGMSFFVCFIFCTIVLLCLKVLKLVSKHRFMKPKSRVSTAKQIKLQHHASH